jgi:hypothetical protein
MISREGEAMLASSWASAPSQQRPHDGTFNHGGRCDGNTGELNMRSLLLWFIGIPIPIIIILWLITGHA